MNGPRVTLPTLLSFDGRGGFRPGRGEAGWTVYAFPSADDRARFMREHPESRMPCWARIERGEAMSARVIRIDWEAWRKTERHMRAVLGVSPFRGESHEVLDALEDLAAHVGRTAEQAHEEAKEQAAQRFLPGASAWLAKQPGGHGFRERGERRRRFHR